MTQFNDIKDDVKELLTELDKVQQTIKAPQKAGKKPKTPKAAKTIIDNISKLILTLNSLSMDDFDTLSNTDEFSIYGSLFNQLFVGWIKEKYYPLVANEQEFELLKNEYSDNIHLCQDITKLQFAWVKEYMVPDFTSVDDFEPYLDKFSEDRNIYKDVRQCQQQWLEDKLAKNLSEQTKASPQTWKKALKKGYENNRYLITFNCSNPSYLKFLKYADQKSPEIIEKVNQAPRSCMPFASTAPTKATIVAQNVNRLAIDNTSRHEELPRRAAVEPDNIDAHESSSEATNPVAVVYSDISI